VEWYHVCWPRLTAKRVEPVVSISWASCLINVNPKMNRNTTGKISNSFPWRRSSLPPVHASRARAGSNEVGFVTFWILLESKVCSVFRHSRPKSWERGWGSWEGAASWGWGRSLGIAVSSPARFGQSPAQTDLSAIFGQKLSGL